MAAPFDSDNMMQRSLFGAIFGFQKKSSNSVSRSRASSIDQPDQPGPSWASAPTHHHVPAAAHLAPVPTATPAASVADSSSDAYFPHHHNHHAFPATGHRPQQPAAPQCPYSGSISFSSLAHQSQAPPAVYPQPPPPPPAPYAPVYGGYAAPPPYSPYPRPPSSHASPTDFFKSKADIYREIVNECEELFERSTTTTPLVESSPATPTLNSPPGSQWCAQQLQQQQQPIHEITNHLSHMMDLPPGNGGYHNNFDHQRVASIVQQIDVKPILGDKIAMEALVRLVVQAVKDTGAIPNAANTQSPEEILKRKRQMNNEAAARYRKRQREEKEKQHGELDTLEQRNLDLKRTVEDMEREIAVLRKYVLDKLPAEAKVEEEQA